jgi:hypothetical protein
MTMKRNQLWPWLVALPWLALPAIALRFWSAWDRLPTSMATHFNATGQANGWMTRAAALNFGLGITALMLAVFTIVAYFMHRADPDGLTWIAAAALQFVVVGILFYANNSILDYNLSAKTVQAVPMLIIAAVATLGFIVIYVWASRGASLPAQPVIAEEVHASPLWALVVLLPVVGEAMVAATVPAPALRAGLILLGIVFAGLAVFVWNGFHYIFTRDGVEIRSLGLRLRSIPLGEIRRYEPGSWNALRGYGIRGIGNSRAYVWGNKGVRIFTRNGEIFLGHNDPQRIVHDLDTIKQVAH